MAGPFETDSLSVVVNLAESGVRPIDLSHCTTVQLPYGFDYLSTVMHDDLENRLGVYPRFRRLYRHDPTWFYFVAVTGSLGLKLNEHFIYFELTRRQLEQSLWRLDENSRRRWLEPPHAVATEPTCQGESKPKHPDDGLGEFLQKARLAGTSWKQARADAEKAGFRKLSSDQAATKLVDGWCRRNNVASTHKRPRIKPD
jgi:hypothetical protein